MNNLITKLEDKFVKQAANLRATKISKLSEWSAYENQYIFGRSYLNYEIPSTHDRELVNYDNWHYNFQDNMYAYW